MSLRTLFRRHRPASFASFAPASDRAIPAAADLLDEVRPGWYREVNPRELLLADANRCVLGQLWGKFHHGEFALEDYLLQRDRSTDVLVAFHGDASDELWRAEVERRRAADPLVAL